MRRNIIPIQKGVRQGDNISPNLFSVISEEIFKNLEREEAGIQINGEYQNNLRYVDDIVIMSKLTDDLQQIIQLHRESQKEDLRSNKITKVIFNNYILDHEIKVDEDVIEYVQDYNYLGQKISANPEYEKKKKKNRDGMECFW